MSHLRAIDLDWSRRMGVGPSAAIAPPQPGPSVSMPAGVDYFIWRLPFSDKLKVSSPAEMDRDWSYPDMLEAHAMLDAIDDVLAKEAAAAAKGDR